MPLTLITVRRSCSLFAIILLLTATSPVFAQLTANFTPSASSGCSPLAVNFTNTSTGTSAGSVYTWTFGNGNGITTSVKNNPVAATYFIGQTYTVTLSIKDGANTSTISKIITVFKKPDINISASPRTVGCIPLTVNFTSAINPGDGTITGAIWSFGDGNSQNTIASTVSNTYISPSIYTVSLTAKNSFGCVNTYTIPDMVTVYPNLVPSFNVDSSAICNLAQAVNFHNTSTGDGALSYTWKFGDGDSSNATNPAHLYATKGNYTISLNVSNNYGCSASTTKPAYINLANFSSDFKIGTSLCSGSPVLFIDQSSPAPTGSPLWNFGDGGSGIGFTYGHSFTAAGTYPVTLYQYFGTCLDSVKKNVTILPSPVISPFILDKGPSCSSPMTVNFTDTSIGASKWHWNFTSNPADTSNSKTPSFTYLTNSLFSPTLTISNANGCSSTISQTFNTAQPTAIIKHDTILIPDPLYCADVQATFRAISADTLQTYSWTIAGPGVNATFTSAKPTYTFITPGLYLIYLNFTTIHGCSGSAYPPDTIRVYPKPHASFDAYDSLPCTTNQVETFINLDDSAAKFTWYYGDGKSDINNDVIHFHNYPAEGSYIMKLVASSPGCPDDDTTIVRYVKTTPIPTLTVANNCDSVRLSAALTVLPGSGDKYVWTFGDGSPDITDLTYVKTRNHLYPKGGVYTASVAVTFGTCIQNTGPVRVYVLDKQNPILSSTKDTICQSAPLPVKITGVDTNYHSKATNAANYYKVVKWQYNDGTTFNANNGFKMTYSGNLTNLIQGKDSIRAIIQSDFFGCYDTTNFIPIHMIGPISKFGDHNQLCYRAPIIFTDSSTAGAGNAPIITWKWDFGDGNSITKPTGDTVQHLYAFPGTYNPKLTVTDTNGCSKTTTISVTQILVYGAKANFTWKPSSITPGFPIEFYNTSIKNTGVTYQWTFASDGSTSTSADSLSHTFPNVGTDVVTLIAIPTMPGACPDTLVQTLKIQNIAAPFIDSSYYPYNNCPPLYVDFTSFPVNTTSLLWDFGDGGGTSTIQNPKAHPYYIPGTYIVKLTGFGANGIYVESYDTIFVKGPFAKLTTPLYKACAPAPDTLYASSSYIGSYTWDFGDGTVLTTQDSIAMHTYTLPGLFTPALILTDSTGCQMSYKSDHQILIDTVFAALGPAVTICGLGSISYGPTVINYAYDTLPSLYPINYHWDFGTGVATDTSNLLNPTFDYTTPGSYITTLEVTSAVGCKALAYDTVRIVGPFVMPVSPDTTICIGGSATLWASNAYEYTWSPGSTLNKTTGDTVIARPPGDTKYTVIGIDSLKCFLDTGYVNVLVDSLPLATIPTPAPVLSGSDVLLEPIVSADVVSYSWAPPDYLSCTDCPNPTSNPLAPTTYTLTVGTARGCTSSTTVNIRLLCLQSGVYMANAFSPNFDGNNDYFYPTGSGVKIVKSFQVYSRWGQLLYSRTNFPPNDKKYGWDGNLNGMQQPADTYVYVTEMICFSGENFVLKGTVELLR